ncbi:POLA2 [Cervus elaphus hippelaphus]|uniref:DNA polymerase alpha subunit B n=1 Tax=Cervus elaphus hippelaphus TaxID=46360 RepID=A0A212DHA2_CEREH|nr:POLA2 [Cervus elaphus hippelaphus]
MASELIAFCTSTRKDCLSLETLNSFEHEGSQKRTVTTPETPLTKRSVSARSPHQLLSPSSFSPSATPPQKYSSRSNRGEVVTSFGSAQGVSWSGRGGTSHLSLKVLGHPEPLTGSYKCMFQKLPDIREVLTCKIEELGSELKEHYKIEAFAPILVPAQEPVTLLGQIGCDSNGKLNHKSVILEGDLEHSSGAQIPVDLSELKEYSLFPGQVVVMEGINTTGRKLVATRLYEGVPLPFHQPDEEDGDSEQFMVLVACGPYTTSDSITFDPLLDLITIINRDRPDVCILRVQLVSEPCTLSINGVIFGLTSTDLLFHMGAEEISRTGCYSAGDQTLPGPRGSVVQFSHHGKEHGAIRVLGEMGVCSSSGTSDRFSRILKHILTQRSYYPLYPPQEDVAIDYENFRLYAQLPVTPDVFIAPSELRYFVKDILGCVCVNPGRLTKGQVGGTFGRLYLRRQTAGGEGRRSPCAAAQVVRI